MSYYHAAFSAIFIAGMAVIAYAVIRAWRHGARELAELQRLGEADDYPVVRDPVCIECLVERDGCERCAGRWQRLTEVVAHSPGVRIEGDPDPALGQHCEYCHGIELDSRECGCGEDGCGRAWCPRYDAEVRW